MLYSETQEIHMHTLKIGVIDVSGVGGYDFDDSGAWRIPGCMRWRRSATSSSTSHSNWHHPMWVQNSDIDLDYHLRRVTVPTPGGRRELDELIGTIASTPLDRSHPLWEMYVVDGLAENRIAIVHKVHHVLADGVASANQMAKAMQSEVSSAPLASMPAQDQSWTRASLLKAAGRDHVGLVRKMPRLVGETAGGVSRVRRRSKERGHHPDLPETSPRQTVSSTTWYHPVAGSRRRRWHCPTSNRRAGTSVSHSTTSCWRRRRARCVGCCCDTTAEPIHP